MERILQFSQSFSDFPVLNVLRKQALCKQDKTIRCWKQGPNLHHSKSYLIASSYVAMVFENVVTY